MQIKNNSNWGAYFRFVLIFKLGLFSKKVLNFLHPIGSTLQFSEVAKRDWNFVSE